MTRDQKLHFRQLTTKFSGSNAQRLEIIIELMLETQST